MTTKTEDRRDQEPASAIRCMEIWGGSEAVDDAISVPGIDAFVRSTPHAGARSGGDIYYVSVCGAGEISRFLLADIAGHGEQAADLAADLRQLLRKHINRANPSRLAAKLNEEFGSLSREGRFATAIVMTYFAPSDTLIVTNAGHPKPLWYDSAQYEWKILAHETPGVSAAGEAGGVGIRNLPLGILEETGYEQYSLRLSPGDLVVAYSDALPEATDADGRVLGEEGLLGIVRTLDGNEPQTLGARIEERVRAFRGGGASDDDMTTLVLYHNAGDPPRLGLGERLRVLGRMLGLGDEGS